MYTHGMHACGIKRYIYSIHAYGFKTVLNTLVLKEVMRNGIIDSSKIALKMEMILQI